LFDIFEKFCILNASLQGNDTNIGVVTKKMRAFIEELSLWIRKTFGNIFSFERFCGGKYVETNDTGIDQCIKNHLVNLECRFPK
jgi:hypothetical protein